MSKRTNSNGNSNASSAPTPEHMRALGSRGGKAVLRKKGKKYFAKLAAMRKHFGGGRPRGSKNKVKQQG